MDCEERKNEISFRIKKWSVANIRLAPFFSAGATQKKRRQASAVINNCSKKITLRAWETTKKNKFKLRFPLKKQIIYDKTV